MDAVIAHSEHGAAGLREEVGLDPASVHIVAELPAIVERSATPESPYKVEYALTKKGRELADALGITRILVTFTHEKTNAVAFAVAVREDGAR